MRKRGTKGLGNTGFCVHKNGRRAPNNGEHLKYPQDRKCFDGNDKEIKGKRSQCGLAEILHICYRIVRYRSGKIGLGQIVKSLWIQAKNWFYWWHGAMQVLRKIWMIHAISCVGAGDGCRGWIIVKFRDSKTNERFSSKLANYEVTPKLWYSWGKHNRYYTNSSPHYTCPSGRFYLYPLSLYLTTAFKEPTFLGLINRQIRYWKHSRGYLYLETLVLLWAFKMH